MTILKDRTRLTDLLSISDFILDGIKTIRDVNRLVNSFLVSYDSLKREIILADLLKLELLKIRYLGAYELLANNMKQFLTSDEDSSSRGAFITYIRDGTGQAAFSRYLYDHFNEVSVSEHQIGDVMRYINS